MTKCTDYTKCIEVYAHDICLLMGGVVHSRVRSIPSSLDILVRVDIARLSGVVNDVGLVLWYA